MVDDVLKSKESLLLSLSLSHTHCHSLSLSLSLSPESLTFDPLGTSPLDKLY